MIQIEIFFKQSKAQIIKTIFKYNKKIESVIANLPISSNELMDQYLKQIELNEEKERRYKCKEKKNCFEKKEIKYDCREKKHHSNEKKEVKCIINSPKHFLTYDEEFKKIDLNIGKKVNHKANELVNKKN